MEKVVPVSPWTVNAPPDMRLFEKSKAEQIWQTVYDAVLDKFNVSLDLH
jgi:hypothetical protein